MTTRRKPPIVTTRRAPAPPAPSSLPLPAPPPAPVNLGPCAVAGCKAPASVEICWPHATPQKFCDAHAEDAMRGRGPRPKAK